MVIVISVCDRDDSGEQALLKGWRLPMLFETQSCSYVKGAKIRGQEKAAAAET